MLASVDHIVLTTNDLERCLDFYTRVLGLKEERYGQGRIALTFGLTNSMSTRRGFNASIKARSARRQDRSICVFWRIALLKRS